MERRKFAKLATLGVLATQATPFLASTSFVGCSTDNSTRVPIGVCNHSLRSMKLNARHLVDYAIREQLDSVLLNTFKPLKKLETNYLQELREYANGNGVSLYIGAGGISVKSTIYSDQYGSPESLLREGIRIAKALGSPIVGCRIGNINDRFVDGGIEAQMELVIGVMKSMKSEAIDAGIKFAFENHAGDLRINELLTIIDETGDDVCGALFDPANALWAMEDPMVAFKELGSKVLATSIRDVTIWPTDRGAKFQGMAIGEGVLDFPLYLKSMAQLCPGVPVHVETISNFYQTIPFLESKFWKGFPNLAASEMVDFLKLVKKGKPLKIAEPPEGMSKREFDIKLQQSELAKSYKYLRKNCNAGRKG